MSRIRLLHWNATEASIYRDLLHTQRHHVEYDPEFRPGMMRHWRESPPDAFVIDLSRLPSHGREIAIALRQSPATRRIPIVFCEGAEDKVSRVRSDLPDAVFSIRSTLLSDLDRAIAQPPRDPVTPKAMMDRYAAKTTAQKLGIKESSMVALIDPPRNYLQVLGELPAGVDLTTVDLSEETPASTPVTLCFLDNCDVLQPTLSRVRELARHTKLWMLWRKGVHKTSRGINERVLRENAIALGLVDYKICSVNEVWSGMLFAAKKNP